jgi:hypothetical protein
MSHTERTSSQDFKEKLCAAFAVASVLLTGFFGLPSSRLHKERMTSRPQGVATIDQKPPSKKKPVPPDAVSPAP